MQPLETISRVECDQDVYGCLWRFPGYCQNSVEDAVKTFRRIFEDCGCCQLRDAPRPLAFVSLQRLFIPVEMFNDGRWNAFYTVCTMFQVASFESPLLMGGATYGPLWIIMLNYHARRQGSGWKYFENTREPKPILKFESGHREIYELLIQVQESLTLMSPWVVVLDRSNCFSCPLGFHVIRISTSLWFTAPVQGERIQGWVQNQRPASERPKWVPIMYMILLSSIFWILPFHSLCMAFLQVPSKSQLSSVYTRMLRHISVELKAHFTVSLKDLWHWQKHLRDWRLFTDWKAANRLSILLNEPRLNENFWRRGPCIDFLEHSLSSEAPTTLQKQSSGQSTHGWGLHFAIIYSQDSWLM